MGSIHAKRIAKIVLIYLLNIKFLAYLFKDSKNGRPMNLSRCGDSMPMQSKKLLKKKTLGILLLSFVILIIQPKSYMIWLNFQRIGPWAASV